MRLLTFGLTSAGVLALLSAGSGCSSDSGGDNSTGGSTAGGAGGKGGGTFAGTGGGSGSSGSGGSSATGGSGATGGKGGTSGTGGSAGGGMCNPGPNLNKKCQDVVMAPDGGTNPCVECLESKCCAVIDACFSDPQCVGLNQCITDNCRGQANLNACANMFCTQCLMNMTSVTKFNEISTCAQAECRSQCFTTPGQDAGSDA